MKQLLYITIVIFVLALGFYGCNDSKTKSKTIGNLKTAYNIEVMTSAKYAAFAEKTREEGMDRLSVLFLSVSTSKSIYAANFKSEIEKLGTSVDTINNFKFEVKTTLDNLHSIIEMESNDLIMYLKFAKEANKEKAANAAKLFNWVQKTEKKHAMFYLDAIQAIKEHWTNAFYTLYFICPTCGNIHYPQQVEDECCICKTKKEKFILKG